MSIRHDFASQLTVDWATIPALEGVRVVATEREIDELEVPTCLVRLNGVGRAPSAPVSHRNVTLLLTLISPHLDMDLAGDEIEELIDAALDYLDTRFLHDDANVVGYNNRLAADIPVTILAEKE